MKYPMFDKNNKPILYEHEFPIILKCEKCGNLRFTFPITFQPQKQRLNMNLVLKKTKVVDIGGRAIAEVVCM